MARHKRKSHSARKASKRAGKKMNPGRAARACRGKKGAAYKKCVSNKMKK